MARKSFIFRVVGAVCYTLMIAALCLSLWMDRDPAKPDRSLLEHAQSMHIMNNCEPTYSVVLSPGEEPKTVWSCTESAYWDYLGLLNGEAIR